MDVDCGWSAPRHDVIQKPPPGTVTTPGRMPDTSVTVEPGHWERRRAQRTARAHGGGSAAPKEGTRAVVPAGSLPMGAIGIRGAPTAGCGLQGMDTMRTRPAITAVAVDPPGIAPDPADPQIGTEPYGMGGDSARGWPALPRFSTATATAATTMTPTTTGGAIRVAHRRCRSANGTPNRSTASRSASSRVRPASCSFSAASSRCARISPKTRRRRSGPPGTRPRSSCR